MTLDVLPEQPAKRQVQSLVAKKKWQQAIYVCREKIAQSAVGDPEKASYYALMGRVFVAQGDDVSAIKAYTESLKQSLSQSQIHQSQTHYALGLLYARQQKPARAICHYQRAIQLQPDWAQAIFRLGSLFHRLGCSLRAFESYEQALAIDPKLPKAHVAIGVMYEQKGELRLAIQHYQKGACLQPDYAEARRGVGRVLTKLEAYDAAVDVYYHTIKTLPNDALTYNNLAQTLQRQGETHRAIKAYKKAISLDNHLTAAYRNLGRLCHTYQALEEATAHFQQALQQSPDSVEALSDYASILLHQGNWEALIDSFRVAINHQPEWIAAYCRRTVQLSEQDLLFRVQRTCGRFLIALQQAKSKETLAILKERLGQVHEYLGDLSVSCDAPTRAEQCYQTALALSPHAPHLYVRLGDCLMKQGRRAAAIATYQAGLNQSQLHQEQQLQTLGSNLHPSAMTASDWQAQLQQRYQRALHHLSEQSDKPSECQIVKGLYSKVADWHAATSAAVQNEATQEQATPSTPTQAGQCGGVTCQGCMSQLIQKFSPVQVGKQSFYCSTAANGIADFPTFTTTIANGSAWIAPQKNAWDVCNEIAIFTPDDFLIGELSRAYPWYLPGCQRHNIEDHTLFKRQTPLPKVQHLSGNVAVLSALSGHIYYHWMFDVLPRIAILKEGLSQQGKTLDDIDFFVVNSINKSFQKETLQTLGIPLEKIVASDSVPHVQADNLVVPSFAGHLDWVPKRSLNFLRETFLKKYFLNGENAVSSSDVGINYAENAKTDRIKNKRIYITRSGAKYRHLFNEKEVVQMLTQFGFTTVTLETLSVAEQIKLFSEAEVIVASHGSGLTNLAFCRAGATVIECFSPNYVRTDYWMISEYLQLNHYYLIGESLKCHPLRQLMYPSGLTEDFSIDVRELRSLLKTAEITI